MPKIESLTNVKDAGNHQLFTIEEVDPNAILDDLEKASEHKEMFPNSFTY